MRIFLKRFFLGAPPHKFTHRRLLQDDGALSHPPAFTWRRRAVRSNAAAPRTWPVMRGGRGSPPVAPPPRQACGADASQAMLAAA